MTTEAYLVEQTARRKLKGEAFLDLVTTTKGPGKRIDIQSIMPDLLASCCRDGQLIPHLIHKQLDEAGDYLLVEDAVMLLSKLPDTRQVGHYYMHAVMSHVLDYWNVEHTLGLSGVALCYYGGSVPNNMKDFLENLKDRRENSRFCRVV